ncbi:MAG: hypothetical protein J5928_02260 [Firmicutes bacterium]|nr:hypothetical protein [Bacillota bacterium]
MKIYSLSGPSGTGKSYQAPILMIDRGIDCLIDDGLLIYKDGVAGGTSAKRQHTKIGAIKTALFTDQAHADSVAAAIKKINPESILVVGTSDEMTDRIAARIGLPGITERIYIEDITTEEEREVAEKSRNQQGKHVIPAPTLQLKRDFAGYFMDPQKLLWTAKERAQEAIATGLHRAKRGESEAKTVVRPTYSYLGDFLINDRVVTDIAKCVGSEVKGVDSVIKVYAGSQPEQLTVNAVIDLRESASIWETAMDFQKRLTDVIEEMTAFNVVRVDIEVRSLVN